MQEHYLTTAAQAWHLYSSVLPASSWASFELGGATPKLAVLVLPQISHAGLSTWTCHRKQVCGRKYNHFGWPKDYIETELCYSLNTCSLILKRSCSLQVSENGKQSHDFGLFFTGLRKLRLGHKPFRSNHKCKCSPSDYLISKTPKFIAIIVFVVSTGTMQEYSTN